MIGSVVEGFFGIVFRLIVVFLFSFTGEIILFILTLGKRVPAWKRKDEEPLIKSFIFLEISVWVGLFFWIFIIWFLVKLLTE